MNEIENYLNKIKKPVTMEKIIQKAALVGLDNSEEVKKIIEDKVANYELIVTDSGKYIPIKKTSFRVGTYHLYKDGNGAVETGDGKFLISAEYTSKVVDGDLVLVDTYSKDKKSCTIRKIIERDINNIVGEVVRDGNSFYVVPEDEKKKNLIIYLEGQDYIDGEKVIVNCNEKRSDNFYVGTIKKSIGHKNEPGVDILMEAYKHGIDNEITEEELKELEAIPHHISDIDRIGRMDFTNKQIFTIDGNDTKDIDDAVSLEILPNGNYLLGVYLADVSHYIKDGSLLDLRARRKGTSSYLADTVIPMFPPKISNGICSLNPNVDRLALGCLMEFDKEGNRVSYNINEFVINSKLQMTYEKVNDILENNIISEEYKPFVQTLKSMELLANKLLKKRILRGCVDLDKPELKLKVDNQGQVIDFDKRYQRTAEGLIEEFMLITNETIAYEMQKNDYPFEYRNHEEPNTEKMEEYLKMLKSLGYNEKFNINDNKLGLKLAEFAKKDEFLGDTLKTRLLRSFRRAFYSPENIGHYGLASDAYCHFTSPIRRYPDLTNHRLIKDFCLSDEDKEKLRKKWSSELDEIAATSSQRERAADDAERMVLLMKTAEYMEKHIGDEYTGTIVGIYDSGMEIELDNMVTGMVRAKDLKGKYFYTPVTESYISLDNQNDYYLGDRLKVSVSSASKERKEINFKVVEKIQENSRVQKNVNNRVRVMEKKKRADMIYYNVNKGKRA